MGPSEPSTRELSLEEAVSVAILLQKNQQLVAASEVYRRVLDRDPSFQEAMIDGGRGREVIAALSAR